MNGPTIKAEAQPRGEGGFGVSGAITAGSLRLRPGAGSPVEMTGLGRGEHSLAKADHLADLDRSARKRCATQKPRVQSAAVGMTGLRRWGRSNQAKSKLNTRFLRSADYRSRGNLLRSK